jgi:hypothetical protein
MIPVRIERRYSVEYALSDGRDVALPCDEHGVMDYSRMNIAQRFAMLDCLPEGKRGTVNCRTFATREEAPDQPTP